MEGGRDGLTVRLGAFCHTRFYIFVYRVFGGGDVILRAADFSQPLQAFVEIARSGHLLIGCRRCVLRLLLNAERGQVVGDRAPKVPQGHDVLRLLRFGLLQPFVAHRLLVLVRRQHDPDPVLSLSFARRTGHFETVARLAGSFLGSGVQREVLGDILRYLKAARDIFLK